jgi:hypothetical protein
VATFVVAIEPVRTLLNCRAPPDPQLSPIRGANSRNQWASSKSDGRAVSEVTYSLHHLEFRGRPRKRTAPFACYSACFLSHLSLLPHFAAAWAIIRPGWNLQQPIDVLTIGKDLLASSMVVRVAKQIDMCGRTGLIDADG